MKKNDLTMKDLGGLGFKLFLWSMFILLILSNFEVAENLSILIGVCSFPVVWGANAWYKTARFSQKVIEIQNEVIQDIQSQLDFASRGQEEAEAEIEMLKTQLGKYMDLYKDMTESWDGLKRLTTDQNKKIVELTTINQELLEDNSAFQHQNKQLKRKIEDQLLKLNDFKTVNSEVIELRAENEELNKKLNSARAVASQRKKALEELNELKVA